MDHPNADEREQLRREAPQCWADVQAAVDAEDPEGLLAMGCPPDEYDPEIADLTRLVLAEQVTRGAVVEIWERWFGPNSNLVRRPDVATRLTVALARLQPR